MKTLSTVLLAILATITLACGYGSKNYATTTPGNKPTITQLSPNSTTAGGAAFNMEIDGTSFNANAVINWNGTPQAASTTYSSTTKLMLAVSSAMIASSGSVSVTVTNPGTAGTGGPYGNGGTAATTSAPMTFTINP